MLHTAGVAAIFAGGALILAAVAIFFLTDSRASLKELRDTDFYVPDVEEESPVISDLYYDAHAEGFKKEKETPKFKRVEESENEASDQGKGPRRKLFQRERASDTGAKEPNRKDSSESRPRQTAPLDETPGPDARFTAPLKEEANIYERKPDLPDRGKSKVSRQTAPLNEPESSPDRVTAPLNVYPDEVKPSDRLTAPLIGSFIESNTSESTREPRRSENRFQTAPLEELLEEAGITDSEDEIDSDTALDNKNFENWMTRPLTK